MATAERPTIRVEHEWLDVCAELPDGSQSVVVKCRRQAGGLGGPRWELSTEDPTGDETLRGSRTYEHVDDVITAATELARRMLVVKQRRAEALVDLDGIVGDFGGSR